jgi:hypothetical protein
MPLKRALYYANDPGTGLQIGLGLYPIFQEDHRLILNRKIIDHYWNREIGMETLSLFTFAMQRRANEIMPLYNQVYKSQLLEFEAISNYKLTTTRADTVNETSTQDSGTNTASTSSSGSRTVGSTLPQTQLARDKNYASSGNDASVTAQSGTDTTANATGENNSEANGTSTTTGYQGSPSDLLMKFRETLLNTDMLVVNEFEDCFMGVWDSTPDTFIPTPLYPAVLRGYRY